MGFGSRGVSLRIAYGGRNLGANKAIVSDYELGVPNGWVEMPPDGIVKEAERPVADAPASEG